MHRLEQFSTSNLCDDVFEQPVRRCKLILGFFWVRRFDWFDLASFALPSWKTQRRDIFAKVSVQVVVVVALSVAVADLPGVSFICCFSTFFYGPKMIALITWRCQLICAQKQHAQRLPSGQTKLLLLLLLLTHICWPHEWNGGPKAATTATTATTFCVSSCAAAA